MHVYVYKNTYEYVGADACEDVDVKVDYNIQHYLYLDFKILYHIIAACSRTYWVA